MKAPIARETLYLRLVADLHGPIDDNETIDDAPSERYLTGVLFPRQAVVGKEEEEGLSTADQDIDGSGSGKGDAIASVNRRRPAAMGVSFLLKTEDAAAKISVMVQGGVYESEDDRAEKGRRLRSKWKRKPIALTVDEIVLTESYRSLPLDAQGLSGFELAIRREKVPEGHAVTVSLVNQNPWAEGGRLNEGRMLFQSALSVRALKGSAFIPRPVRRLTDDEDGRISALIYRDRLEFAVGHTCSADWEEHEGRVDSVQTAWIPRAIVAAVSADGDVAFDELRGDDKNPVFSAKWLSSAPRDVLISKLERFITCYSGWVEGHASKIPGIAKEHRAQASENLARCRVAVERMRGGLSVLKDEGAPLQTFRLANRAMWLQRHWATKSKDLTWRPFQLGFQLLVLRSLAEPGHDERKIMDLLWFPTGGGKTEAYLFLTAFTMIGRRLRSKGGAAGDGVAVLMRYTLRALTLQQLERAAALVLACECLRQGRHCEGTGIPNGLMGKTSFSIGLWVGQDATPNTMYQARKDERIAPVLSMCPACGNKLAFEDRNNFRHVCREKTCDLGPAHLPFLPLWFIDEQIYNQKPSFVIGTVDKFASVPRKLESGILFGIDTPHDAPDLIIQDELHLISGPLGSMAGLYEAAIERLCLHKGRSPKVIGSTATIRRAQEQVKALFGRDTFQFPPPLIDAENSCFAVRSKTSPGRLYVGLTTAGRSAKLSLQAVAASLLQGAKAAAIPDDQRDPYWTLVVYFNALRELGAALSLMQDDVSLSISSIAARRGESAREQRFPPAEMTSRASQEDIRSALDDLKRTWDDDDSIWALLASNMISVGIDIPRLGLMVMNNQPKSMAEYIQATSRVGRGEVAGMIVVLYNDAKVRDRAHYESFQSWHQALYREVEAMSVTPFSSRAIDKALPAILVMMARHLIPELRNSPKLNDGKGLLRKKVKELAGFIVERVRATDKDQEEQLVAAIDRFIDHWHDKKDIKEYFSSKPGSPLLASAEDLAARREAQGGFEQDGDPVAVPSSLRNVEATTEFVFAPGLRGSRNG